jgi:MarR family transcriptional regulator, transcriptional regulator for hemolysin
MVKINFLDAKKIVDLYSCINNYMSNNQFKKGELYSFITGKASTAIARRLQKNFKQSGLEITIEQWSVLYHLWKQEGQSQQQLCDATFRDKPSITRLVDNLEKLKLVKRVPSKEDRRINLIYLTKEALHLQEKTMIVANKTLNEALDGVTNGQIEIAKEVLQKVYDNLASAF